MSNKSPNATESKSPNATELKDLPTVVLPTMLVISWVDPKLDEGFTAKEDLAPLTNNPHLLHTLGFLVDHDDACIRLASSVSDTELGYLVTIPKQSIISSSTLLLPPSPKAALVPNPKE